MFVFTYKVTHRVSCHYELDDFVKVYCNEIT